MPRVRIEERGRGGTVTYHESMRRLDGSWEFGGADDVVAIVQFGNEAEWSRHPWTAGRRAEILTFIADEVVRQKAPSCWTEIDLQAGHILLRPSNAVASTPGSGNASLTRTGAPPVATSAARSAEAAWVFRLTALRARLGWIVFAAAMLLGGALWIRDSLFSIDPGKGTNIGLSVRTDRHVATLIETLEPYVPTLNRNHGDDRYRISLLLVPLDGSAARLIPLRRGLSPNASSVAQIFGSDGRTLWFDAAGVGGLDLATGELLPEGEAAKVDPRSLPRPWGASPLPPRLENFLMPASDVAAAEGGITLNATYLEAKFVRENNANRPLRLVGPPGALLVYASARGMPGTAVVARVDPAGRALWTVDTGIALSGLQQVLPGRDSTVLIGTRPQVPDKLSEPLLVAVDHASGRAITHSLWQ